MLLVKVMAVLLWGRGMRGVAVGMGRGVPDEGGVLGPTWSV